MHLRILEDSSIMLFPYIPHGESWKELPYVIENWILKGKLSPYKYCFLNIIRLHVQLAHA